MPPRKPALDRSYHYPLEVLELLVATIPRLIKTRAGILEFFAEAGAPKELIAEWRAKLHQGRMGVSSKYHLVRGFLRGLNTLGDDGQAVREEVLRRLARHADFSTGWEDDRQRAEELVARIRELAGETDAGTWNTACHEALTRQAPLETGQDSEHPLTGLEALKRDLYRAFRVTDPAERRAILDSVLPRLFTCHDIPTRQATAAPPVDDAAVLIDFEEALFLVELRWSDRPLDFRQLAPHLVTLYGCPDLRGLLISSSGFTDQAIRDLSSIQPQRLVLCHLQEIVLLLEQGRDLKEWLRAKVRAAETEQKPFVRGA
jgi:restriction system protein